MKTREMGAIPPSAILSQKGIARYGGVSRTGPLSRLLYCSSSAAGFLTPRSQKIDQFGHLLVCAVPLPGTGNRIQIQTLVVNCTSLVVNFKYL